MKRLMKFLSERFLNGGAILVLMGVLWLYLWVFPWHEEYLDEPLWGHNYPMAISFVAVGLAYLNNRFLSSILGFLTSLVIVPATLVADGGLLFPPLSFLPFPVQTTIAGVLAALIAIDALVEGKRERDFLQPGDERLAFWLKRCFRYLSYAMIAHIGFIYFLVRLPFGTWEIGLDTIIFNVLVIPLAILLILQDLPIKTRVLFEKLSFFWGIFIMVALLIVESDEPATWPVSGIVVGVTLLSVSALLIFRKRTA